MTYRTIFILSALFLVSLACAIGPNILGQDREPTASALTTGEPPTPPTATASPEPTQTVPAEPTPVPTTPPAEEAGAALYSVEVGEDGWTRYTYHQDGFAVSIPSGWSNVDLAAANIEQALQGVGEANANLNEVYSSEYLRQMAAAGIKFMALETSQESLTAGIPLSLNIVVMKLAVNIPFDTFVAVNIDQIQQVFGVDALLEQERTSLDGVEAEKLSYSTLMNDVFSTHHQVLFLQYLLLHNQNQYVLTFGGVEEIMAANLPVCLQIAETFSLTD